MKWISIASLTILVMGGGAVAYYGATSSQPASQPTTTAASATDAAIFLGTYVSVCGTSRTNLSLKGDGTYVAASSGCFTCWDVSGNWHVEGNTLLLSPGEAKTENYLRALDIVDDGDAFVLVRSEDRERFRKEPELYCFRRER
jgi:hypothetical protein